MPDNMADDESTEQTSLQCEDVEEEEKSEPKTRREKLGAFLQSNPIQYGILALVVVDVVIVILEILIDFGMIVIPENTDTSLSANGSSYYGNNSHFDLYNSTHVYHQFEAHVLHSAEDASSLETHHEVTTSQHGNISTNHSLHHSNISDHHDGVHHGGGHHHSNKEIIGHTLHYSSLTILAIFVVEVFCKLIAEGWHFFKHKAEVFDAIIVLVSFSMDVAFSFITVDSTARDATGLMVLLRLWRVTRIVNGVIMSVKKDADKKIHEQKAARLKAEEEVERLRGKIESLQTDLEKLKKRLKKYENNSTSNNDDKPDETKPTDSADCNNISPEPGGSR